MNQEVWVDVKGSEGEYQVSSFGNVRSLDLKRNIVDSMGRTYQKIIKGRTLKTNDNGKGYLYVNMGRNKREYVHRLVCEGFLNNKNNLLEINHIDNNPNNNRLSNLEWTDRKANIEHKVNQGRQTKGEDSHLSKLNENKVKEIRNLLNEGVSIKEICKRYNVKQTAISKIKRRVSWKHVV